VTAATRPEEGIGVGVVEIGQQLSKRGCVLADALADDVHSPGALWNVVGCTYAARRVELAQPGSLFGSVGPSLSQRGQESALVLPGPKAHVNVQPGTMKRDAVIGELGAREAPVLRKEMKHCGRLRPDDVARIRVLGHKDSIEPPDWPRQSVQIVDTARAPRGMSGCFLGWTSESAMPW